MSGLTARKGTRLQSQDRCVIGNRFVFIGGLHRSGTSLLHEILRCHPDMSGFSETGVPEDEGQHLQKVYPPAKAFGGPGRFGFDKASFMDEGHPLATPENGARLYEQWRPWWDTSKSVLLEKSPPNLVRTRFLQQLFPGSRFIILLRHPVAVAYATRKWCHNSIPDLVEHNLRCYERFLEDMPKLKQVLVLRYEEFVQNPEEHIGKIFDWLGVARVTFPQQVRSDINARYLAKWRKDCRRLKGYKMKIQCLFRRFQKRSAVFGYSIRTPEILLPSGMTGIHAYSVARDDGR